MNKILVINNDLDTMTLLQRLLERNGFVVKFTGNKDESINIIRDFQPSLVLVDIAQTEVISRLLEYKEENPISIILMTGYSQREKHIESRVDDVIEKPFEFDLLQYKINCQLKMAG